jgi:hypothetical protein
LTSLVPAGPSPRFHCSTRTRASLERAGRCILHLVLIQFLGTHNNNDVNNGSMVSTRLGPKTTSRTRSPVEVVPKLCEICASIDGWLAGCEWWAVLDLQDRTVIKSDGDELQVSLRRQTLTGWRSFLLLAVLVSMSHPHCSLEKTAAALGQTEIQIFQRLFVFDSFELLPLPLPLPLALALL